MSEFWSEMNRMSDKRQVATDALETLGSIIGENEKRDAIHLAVEPVIAGEFLYPGAEVGIETSGLERRAYRKAKKLVGIVDPFLKSGVEEGQRFWLVVYPRQITSLRHVWAHPDFPDAVGIPVHKEDAASALSRDRVKVSELWLREFSQDKGISYATLITAALKNESSEYLLISGEDASGSIPIEFWDHVEIATGEEIPPYQRAQSFSCSC